MKKLLFVIVLALLPIKAGNVSSKKITGAAATVQLSTTSTTVRWIQLVADAANASDVKWGDCTVTSSANGGDLPKGSGQMLPPGAQGGYDPSQVCVYVAMSDIVYVSWETF